MKIHKTWGRYGQFNIERSKTAFLSKVQQTGECWLWTGAKSSHGYGSASFQGKAWSAHRLSYLLHYEEDPGSLEVMHSCDTPLCVNPAHLSTGTHRENLLDAESKGLVPHPFGEKHGRAKITNQQAQEILDRYRQGNIGMRPLAAEFGISRTAIRNIVRRRGWKNIE